MLRGGVAFLLMAGASAEIASYWGAWAGFGLMALCWLANPAWRATVRTPIGAYAEMTRFGILLASTVLFLFSGNLWLTWGYTWGPGGSRSLPRPVCTVPCSTARHRVKSTTSAFAPACGGQSWPSRRWGRPAAWPKWVKRSLLLPQ
ncbi:MAG: hypothetical protein HZY76_15070 [Anaerolineae bacterium]|nr:MAG: hypothetical protein HZY76_15070 [Anaerolineae bacterium]